LHNKSKFLTEIHIHYDIQIYSFVRVADSLEDGTEPA